MQKQLTLDDLLKYLPALIAALIGLGGFGIAASSGTQVYAAGEGNGLDWIKIIGGGGAGIISLILSSSWFTKLAKPSPKVAMASAVVLAGYYAPDTIHGKAVRAIAADLGMAFLPVPPVTVTTAVPSQTKTTVIVPPELST